MSGVGLDWYQREPVPYLNDVQGLSAKEHAVYSVIIDLLYVHGGVIQNDPSFISGYISDMGSSAVRTAIKSLDGIERITLIVTDAKISQERAQKQCKTKSKLSKTNSISGKKGGEKTAKLKSDRKENNNLTQASATLEIQAEKRREEKRREHNIGARARNDDDLTFRERIIVAMGHDVSGLTVNGRMMGAPTDMLEVKRWAALGLSEDEILGVITEVTTNKSDGPAGAFKYFSNSMAKFAGIKAQPDLQPTMPVGGQRNGNGYYNGQTRGDVELAKAVQRSINIGRIPKTQEPDIF